MGYRTWIDYIAQLDPANNGKITSAHESTLVDAVAEVYAKDIPTVERAVRRARKAADARPVDDRPSGASEPERAPYRVCVRIGTDMACHSACLPEVGIGAPCRHGLSYAERVAALERRGLSTSDAQAVVDAMESGELREPRAEPYSVPSTRPYVFHADPGHGWLQVPVAELVALGIAGKVTRYSYLSADRRTAFLEEDCDVATFFRAKGWTNWPEGLIDERFHGDFSTSGLAPHRYEGVSHD